MSNLTSYYKLKATYEVFKEELPELIREIVEEKLKEMEIDAYHEVVRFNEDTEYYDFTEEENEYIKDLAGQNSFEGFEPVELAAYKYHILKLKGKDEELLEKAERIYAIEMAYHMYYHNQKRPIRRLSYRPNMGMVQIAYEFLSNMDE